MRYGDLWPLICQLRTYLSPTANGCDDRESDIGYGRYLVPGGGLEPPHCYQRRILNPLRLPIPPSRQGCRPRMQPATEAAHYRRIGQAPARRQLQSLIPRLTALPPLESLMNTQYPSFDDVHPSAETATHPIARFSSRLAALLLVAGDGHAPPRALPANLKIAHSGTFNRGIKDNRAPCRLPILISICPTS